MPRPRHHNPDPLQMTLTLDFGQQMDVFRTMRIGPFSHRWMMFVVWSHLGRNRSTWRMSADDLGAEMQMDKHAAMKIARSLDHLGVLRRVEVSKNQYEFGIVWGVLFGLRDGAEEWSSASDNTAQAPSNTAQAPSNTAQAPSNTAQAPSALYRTMNYTEPPSTPSTADADETRMMVMMKLKETGVGQVGPTIASAEAQGMTLVQIAAVIGHYQAHPGRWPQGVLCERLTRSNANILDASDGWYGDTDQWKHEQARIEREAQARAAHTHQAEEDAMSKLITYPQQDFAEAKFGPLLDEMTNPQAAALVQDDSFVAKLCLKGNHRKPGMVRERCISRMQHLAAIEREKQERQASLATVTE